MDRRREQRSRSPTRRHDRTHRDRKTSPNRNPTKLPFGAQALSKHDLARYRATFALYLDVQKHIFIEDLDSDEVKGRWKSFLGKWYVRGLTVAPAEDLPLT